MQPALQWRTEYAGSISSLAQYKISNMSSTCESKECMCESVCVKRMFVTVFVARKQISQGVRGLHLAGSKSQV